MQFPNFDPIAIQLGPLAIRWYALAFISGLLAGWGYIVYLLQRPPTVMTKTDVSDFFTWAIIGVVAGGRVGYVSFYMPGYYASNPLEVFFLWQGGMSFHGGLIGMLVVIAAFAHKRKVTLLALSDLVAAATPIGLFLGRIANFINGELYGRPTDVPWAVVFPGAGEVGRHPSQLYEAALEGLVLFLVLFALARFASARTRPGLITGVFLLGYGIARTIVETVREPDIQIGYLLGGATLGQLLSIPLVLGGIWLISRAGRSASKPA